jgi:hypothetical protein
MAELGLEPPVPPDLESLGREIMAVVHPTSKDTGGLHAVTTQQPADREEDQPRDGFSDQGSVERMVDPASERPRRKRELFGRTRHRDERCEMR